METLRKTKWISKLMILGFFLMLLTFGCDEDENRPSNELPVRETFSGVQTVVITNASGTLVEINREITATLRYPNKGKLEITLCEQFEGMGKKCKLEGAITNGQNISVKYVVDSKASTYESDEYVNSSFEEYFELSELEIFDCPEWSGTLNDDQLELSCDFCCDAPWMKDLGTGSISCSLVRM